MSDGRKSLCFFRKSSPRTERAGYLSTYLSFAPGARFCDRTLRKPGTIS